MQSNNIYWDYIKPLNTSNCISLYLIQLKPQACNVHKSILISCHHQVVEGMGKNQRQNKGEGRCEVKSMGGCNGGDMQGCKS